MKNLLKIVVAAVLAPVLFYSCSGDNTREDQAAAIIGKMDSPFVVVNMVPQNLMDKSNIFGGAIPETFALVIGFFIDEKVTGIDYSVKSQFVVSAGSGFTPNMYVIFKVKDQDKFKELMDKEANADIGEKDGFNYAIKESEMYCVTWNEEFAILSNIPIDFAAMLSGGGGDQGMSQITKNIDLINAAEDGEADATYAEFLKKEGDLSVYYDGKGLFKYLEGMEAMKENEDLQKMKETYEGMSVEMYLNFTNGSMDFEWITTLTEDVKKKMDFIGNKGVDSKLLAQGNSEMPVAVGSYSIDIKAFLDYFKENAGEDGLDDINDGLAEIGLNLDDAARAFSGEMVWILDDIRTITKTVDYGYGDGPISYETTEPLFGMVVGVKDKSVIEKALKAIMDESEAAGQMAVSENMSEEEKMNMMMESAMRGPEIVKLGEGIYQADEGFFYIGSDVLFVSNDSAWTMNVAAGKASKVKDVKGDLGKYPFAFYTNFAQIAKIESMKEGKEMLDIFSEFHGGGNMDGGNFHLIMMDKKRNALEIITEMVFDQINKAEQMNNPQIMEEFEDSAEECEGGACEEGACEAGSCEGGEEKPEEY